MTNYPDLMKGKRGVILGVANNRSIAWGIAKACHAAGAEIALTWQGDALKKRVEPLAGELNGLLLGHCDVTDHTTIDAVFQVAKEKWSTIDFVVHAIAFSDKDQLDGRYLETTADNFSRTMLISCYSLTAIAQRAEKLMADGGSILTLTYYGAEKWMRTTTSWVLQRPHLRPACAISPPISARRTSASMPSRRGRSRRWRPQASAISAAF